MKAVLSRLLASAGDWWAGSRVRVFLWIAGLGLLAGLSAVSWMKGKSAGDVACAEKFTRQQEVRADVAERQREIASGPRLRGAALLDGLSGTGGR